MSLGNSLPCAFVAVHGETLTPVPSPFITTRHPNLRGQYQWHRRHGFLSRAEWHDVLLRRGEWECTGHANRARHQHGDHNCPETTCQQFRASRACPSSPRCSSICCPSESRTGRKDASSGQMASYQSLLPCLCWSSRRRTDVQRGEGMAFSDFCTASRPYTQSETRPPIASWRSFSNNWICVLLRSRRCYDRSCRSRPWQKLRLGFPDKHVRTGVEAGPNSPASVAVQGIASPLLP